MVTVQLDPNHPKVNLKQIEFFNSVMNEVWKYENGKQTAEDFRYFFYGGAIRGGKTVICLAILFVLAKKYPMSRAHVIRRSFPDIQSSTIPSAQKILRYSTELKWKMSISDCFVEFQNGSRVYFMSENSQNDPDLGRFKGLETNFFLLEQIDELQQKTFNKAIERVGSWGGCIGEQPPPFIFATFNPTSSWVKVQVHDKHEKGNLPPPYYYQIALPEHNPWVTDEQWRGWQNMDTDSYNRFIRGVWDIPVKDQFVYSFDKRKNITTGLEVDYSQEIILTFDFNVDPMTALLIQSDRSTFSRTIKEFRIPNSDTYEMCRTIKPYIEGYEHLVTATGDSSGKSRISGTRGHINQFQIIMQELQLNARQFAIPSVNPLIADSRVFINSLTEKLPEMVIDSTCEFLIKDLQFCMIDRNASGDVAIKKAGMNEHTGISNSQMGHLLDCFRYAHHVLFLNWLEIPHS